MGGNEHGNEQVILPAPLTVHQCTAAVSIIKIILLLNGSHLFSVISYVVLIVINHPKL